MDHYIEIITTISEHERSSVFLATYNTVNSAEPGSFVILKKLSGDINVPVFKRIQALNSDYFPKIIDVKTSNGNTEIVEEYIEGRELSRVLADTFPDEEEALSYMKQLIEAICILHNMEPPLIHRDIKPENILITGNGQLKLLDFDAAREWNSDNRESDTVLLGTRGYAAPEQFGYSQTDARSDLYSAGIVCRQICEKSIISDQKKNRLKAFYDKATMFDPNERYQSAGEMLDALNRAVDGSERKNTLKRPLAGIAVIAVFLAIAAMFCFIFANKGKVYNFDILPDDYIYKGIHSRINVYAEKTGYLPDEYPGLVLKEGNEQTTDLYSADAPILRFVKDSPQAILISDYRLDSFNSIKVRLDRFAGDGIKTVDHLQLRGQIDYDTRDGFICIYVGALESLQDGIYSLVIESMNKDFAWIYRLEVCSTADKDDRADLCPLGSIQYYVSSVENEIIFNLYNAASKITKVRCSGRLIDRSAYRLTEDGKGALLGKSFIEACGTDSERLELEFETEDGRTATGLMICIP